VIIILNLEYYKPKSEKELHSLIEKRLDKIAEMIVALSKLMKKYTKTITAENQKRFSRFTLSKPLLLIALVFISGCVNSYQSCKSDCDNIQIKIICGNATNSIDYWKVPCLDNNERKIHCYNECKPK